MDASFRYQSWSYATHDPRERSLSGATGGFLASVLQMQLIQQIATLKDEIRELRSPLNQITSVTSQSRPEHSF
jgi:hypothetical protein